MITIRLEKEAQDGTHVGRGRSRRSRTVKALHVGVASEGVLALHELVSPCGLMLLLRIAII